MTLPNPQPRELQTDLHHPFLVDSNRNPRKPLPASIQMLGDLIQIRRYENRLTLWQLAQKMGIVTVSVPG